MKRAENWWGLSCSWMKANKAASLLYCHEIQVKILPEWIYRIQMSPILDPFVIYSQNFIFAKTNMKKFLDMCQWPKLPNGTLESFHLLFWQLIQQFSNFVNIRQSMSYHLSQGDIDWNVCFWYRNIQDLLNVHQKAINLCSW